MRNFTTDDHATLLAEWREEYEDDTYGDASGWTENFAEIMNRNKAEREQQQRIDKALAVGYAELDVKHKMGYAPRPNNPDFDRHGLFSC